MHSFYVMEHIPNIKLNYILSHKKTTNIKELKLYRMCFNHIQTIITEITAYIVKRQ